MDEINDTMTIEEMASQLGGPAPTTPPTEEIPPAPTEDPKPTEDPAPTEHEEQPGGGDSPPSEDPEQKPNPNEPTAASKAQTAFIHMRQENKRLSDALKSVAGLAGVENQEDPEKLLSALQQKVLESEANKQNVPVELLQRLQDLEQKDKQFTAMQRQSAIEQGFQKVKDEYKLTDQQMTAFAEELIAAGLNPLEKEVNLFKEYRDIHFNDIVQAAVDKAVAAEQQRSKQAQEGNSDPGNRQGAGGTGEPAKINSVRDLNTYFAGM